MLSHILTGLAFLTIPLVFTPASSAADGTIVLLKWDDLSGKTASHERAAELARRP